jgi:hypothetical protein
MRFMVEENWRRIIEEEKREGRRRSKLRYKGPVD